MPEPIREQVLSALANALGAHRVPMALEVEEKRIIQLYDEEETIVNEWDNSIHTMMAQITVVDKYDEEVIQQSTVANRLLAEIQTLVLADQTLGGLCESVSIKEATTAYVDDPSNYTGAVLGVSVVYRTAHNNLYALP